MASNEVDEQDPLSPLYEAFSSGEDDENDPSAMSLIDHLEELLLLRRAHGRSYRWIVTTSPAG